MKTSLLLMAALLAGCETVPEDKTLAMKTAPAVEHSPDAKMYEQYGRYAKQSHAAHMESERIYQEAMKAKLNNEVANKELREQWLAERAEKIQAAIETTDMVEVPEGAAAKAELPPQLVEAHDAHEGRKHDDVDVPERAEAKMEPTRQELADNFTGLRVRVRSGNTCPHCDSFRAMFKRELVPKGWTIGEGPDYDVWIVEEDPDSGSHPYFEQVIDGKVTNVKDSFNGKKSDFDLIMSKHPRSPKANHYSSHHAKRGLKPPPAPAAHFHVEDDVHGHHGHSHESNTVVPERVQPRASSRYSEPITVVDCSRPDHPVLGYRYAEPDCAQPAMAPDCAQPSMMAAPDCAQPQMQTAPDCGSAYGASDCAQPMMAPDCAAPQSYGGQFQYQ